MATLDGRYTQTPLLQGDSGSTALVSATTGLFVFRPGCWAAAADGATTAGATTGGGATTTTDAAAAGTEEDREVAATAGIEIAGGAAAAGGFVACEGGAATETLDETAWPLTNAECISEMYNIIFILLFFLIIVSSLKE